MKRCFAFAAIAVTLAAAARADVRLPKILASHMVLQRNADVALWGWAEPGENVTVSGDWLQQPAKATADADGNWRVRIKTPEAGGPHRITVKGKNEVKLEDVLFGEVWIGSGQSNMEMPLIRVSGAYTAIKDADKEVAAADHPQIRLFRVGNHSSKEPLADVQPGAAMYGVPPSDCKWSACSPETVKVFASTAYFFARELHKELKVPIGIIDSSWGGTAAESWTPIAALEKLGETKQVERAKTQAENPNRQVPTRLYNGMIHPLLPLRIKGAIWYQGESNTGRAAKYRDLLTAMIRSWRGGFGQDFPFYFVEIAPFNYGGVNCAYLREAQLQTLALQRTGMAATIDIGNARDIHPKNKQEVGRRLALWALANDYGRDLVCSGPLYKDHKVEGNKIRIRFDYTGGGLTTRDGKAPSHFSIAGEDRKFHPATAAIDGNDVVVSADNVASPEAVRFAFGNLSVPNLTNREGLPALSFRTDSW